MKRIVLVALLGIYGILFCQIFTDINAGLIGSNLGTVAWGDYDNDGYLDCVVSGGSIGFGYVAKIYKNNQNSSFSDINAGLTGVDHCTFSWGDYDNDGDLDLFYSGKTSSSAIISGIYKNNEGDFESFNAGIAAVWDSSSDWGDYDNDGDLDILITGYTGTSVISRIYRNDSGSFTDMNAGLVGVVRGSARFGDLDNDGDLDVLITGGTNLTTPVNPITKIYRNDNGSFTDINAPIVAVYGSRTDFGDYDNDGDLDILLSGDNINGKIYRNDSSTFTNIFSTTYPCTECAWGDYDGDGDLDALLLGGTGSIYNNTNNNFTLQSNTGLEIDLMNACIEWGDFDNNGDLDILIAGLIPFPMATTVTKILRNNLSAVNTKPDAPANLTSITNFNSATLSWDQAYDAETPADGLSYNIYVSTVSGEENIKNSMSDASNGFRKIVNIGNAGQNTTWTIKNLPCGTYYWSVQAVDHEFAGSAFTEEQVFYIGPWIYTDDSSTTLYWDEYVGATGYNIYKSEYPDTGYTLIDNVTELEYVDITKKIDYEIYFYKIEAVTSTTNIMSSVVGYRKSLCYNPGFPDYNDISLAFEGWYTLSNEINPNGSQFKAISKWDASEQSWSTSNYITWLGVWSNVFEVYTGQCYRLANLPANFYFISEGNYTEVNPYNLITNSIPEEEDYNFIMHPLKEYDLTMAGSGIGDDIGACDKVQKWLPTTQTEYITTKTDGVWENDYYSKIGLPLFVNMTGNVTWPDQESKGQKIDKSENVTEVNLPKAVYFHVVNALNEEYNFNDTNPNIEFTQPVDGFISFKAWITNREEDILTEQNYGCGFEQLGGLYSTVYINLGNFKYKWAENDVINIEIADNSKNSSVVLKGIGKSLASYDEESSLRGFEPIIKGTGDPIVLDVPSGNDEMIPYQTVLFQNYPNPFNPATEIKFSLKNDSNVKLFVYNYNGQLVRELVNGKLFKGFHSVNFDANALSSGLYFYTLETDGKRFVKKMVLTR